MRTSCRLETHSKCVAVFFCAALVALASTAGAQGSPPPQIDTGDTAWLLTSSALVLVMTPALAFFYGGMVRSKNVLATIMHSFFIIALVSVQWALYGYSLGFGPDIGGFVGSLKWVGLNGVGLDAYPDYAATVPHQAFMVFQMMFAVITPALITGGFAERMSFKAFVVFTLLWCTLVYDPVAHWVWGVGGWLRGMGALDFAGGTVVHINSGVAALAAALVMGRRIGYPKEPMPPNNLTLTVLGAGVLWFGWFGFNAGSALASGALATSAFVVTHLAAATATLSWCLAEYVARGKASVLGAASGSVAGLVAITPASGYVTPLAAIVIGCVVGVLCYWAVNMKHRFGYDDSLDVFGVHGVGGTWGAIATGIFATKAINSAGGDGLLYGNPGQLGVQFVGVAATAIYSFVLTFIILKVVDATVGLRVAEHDEITGLDLSQHGEVGYNF
jgi:Amt family ammonium transporter